MQTMKAYCASIFHLVDNPMQVQNPADAYQYWEDGMLLVEEGKIKSVGPASAIRPNCRKRCRWFPMGTP